jgi:hypothetical protein
MSGKAKDAKEEDADTALRTVVLSLDGRAHDLQVGYVAAAPVWRPSYRLVVLPSGQADLQAWGIVQNLSGEDWTDVKLSLVAGAPLAFEAQLGTPIIPPRPVVTDSGEVIVSVPKGDTSVADRDADGVPDDKDAEETEKAEKKSANAPAPPPPAASVAATGQAAAVANKEGGTGTRAKGEEGAMGNPSPITTPRREGYIQPSQPRNVHSLAAVAAQGGSTRYDIPSAITITDKNATMVMLLDQKVHGQAIYLFAPDDGVPDSTSHPFHVVRFQNETTGVLERGPIAVFQQGSFLGQGLLDPLPTAAWATVPFALERAIGVDSHQKGDVQGTRVSKIENGNLWLEHDVVLKTTYTIQNGGELEAKILVKHPRRSGARLYLPPEGTEDNVGTGAALVPVNVPAHGHGELVVDEREAQPEYADWFGVAADKAVKAYTSDPRADPKLVVQLNALWPLRGTIVSKQDQRNKIQNELAQLHNEAYQKRADLKAIEKNKAAEGLRRTLTARLAAIGTREDALTAQNITVGQDLSDLYVKWREGVAALHLAEAPKPKD